jgi:hypothetical protein
MQRYSAPAVRLSSCLAGVVLSLLLLGGASAWAQEVTGEDVPPPLPDGIFEQATGPYLSNLSATDEDALFTTYAAPLRRSKYIVDEGYQFKFYEAKKGLRFVSDYGGDCGVAFRRGNDGRYRPADFSRKPVVTLSYSDMVGFRYRPYEHVQVESFFQVYSSRQALQHLSITNTGSETISLRVMPYLQRSTPFSQVVSDADRRYVTFRHRQEPDGWTKRKSSVPHVTERQNVFRISEPAEAIAHYQQGGESALQKALSVKEPEHTSQSDSARVVALHTALRLPPGATKQLRIIRGVAGTNSDQPLRSTNQDLMAYNVSQAIQSNEALYRSVPRFDFEDDDRRLMYWSAFNLLRQNMLPPEGKTSYNYYVYSREPTWGWGHAGQVFHESLSMLAYVSLDAQSALNSQRVYMERQWQNGYVEYRAGPYLDATNFTRGSFTSSAPWYSYENWKLYQSTGNRTFLRDAYQSGKNFYTWWINNRDQDDDGLVEWGGHAVLESVRDANVALWHDVGWPSNFEAPELNSMLVKEARALAKMAKALGDSTGAKRWRREAQTRTEAIQETFWDSETGFFYYVDRDDHNFSYDEKNDLKRREITGFIPLWAGTATDAQAKRLVEEHLTDSTEFWRPYGVPSLSASDSYYDPQGYWNGPVWVEWQFLLVRGLQNYGYHAEADELADRVFENVIHHLKTSHTFWEFYSPDAHWAGHHQTYIWTGLVARMLMDLRQARPVPKSAP